MTIERSVLADRIAVLSAELVFAAVRLVPRRPVATELARSGISYPNPAIRAPRQTRRLPLKTRRRRKIISPADEHIWDRGVRWANVGRRSSTSPPTRSSRPTCGHVHTWGFDIREIRARLPYDVENAEPKGWVGVDGLRKRVCASGYELLASGGSYGLRRLPSSSGSPGILSRWVGRSPARAPREAPAMTGLT
jgi:hypothetical protein